MSNIIINFKKRTIEINKTFASAASKFGSTEYNDLLMACHDNPSFRVITVSKKKSHPIYKGLTYEYMEMYIAKHDKEDNSIMSEYMKKRATLISILRQIATSTTRNI